MCSVSMSLSGPHPAMHSNAAPLHVDALIDKVRSYLPDENCLPIEQAYTYSLRAHAGQVRASGESYFTHAYAVATVLTEIRMDVPTIAAALLHDVLEDTQTSSGDIRSVFGDEIASLVEGVTKISSYHCLDQEMAAAENWRKMLLAITRDIRVILVKFADRLHNMRTIEYLPADKQRRIATETLILYAPFAQRLGVYRWKSELEDLSFAVLHPDEYRRLRLAWEMRQESSIQQLEEWKHRLTEVILPCGMPFRLSARPKSLYGIWKKMERQAKPLSDIQDLIGLRLITDTVEHCYAMLGTVHTAFRPVPGTFTDYIHMPKINMYQSLHTTLQGDHDVCAEIQIRTEEMHRRCEFGIAAHWRYKEHRPHPSLGATGSKEIDGKLDWLKQVLEWQDELRDPREFLMALRTECTFDQVFVFTPKGKVMVLPAGATPIDFAYAVHTDIGDHCFGAKIDGKMVTLDHILQTGCTCEVLTRKNAHPSKHWLDFAITAQARAKIRRYLREQGGEL